MNLAKFLEASALRHPDKTAIRHESGRITYQELDRASNRFANGLTDLGLSYGDRCMVMMPNSIEYVALYYALAKMGIEIIPVNFLFKSHELSHIFKDAGPKAFIGAGAYLEEISRVFKETGSPPIRLALKPPEGGDCGDLESCYSDRDTFSLHPTGTDDTLNIH
jgi:long-chain acyl-CoA synthetase